MAARMADSIASAARAGTIPEVPANALSYFVHNARQPCIIRGAGNDLEVVKGCCSHKEHPEGVHWLAEKAGMAKFRVFVAQPANEKQSSQVSTFTLDGTEHPDCILTTSCSLDLTLAEMMNNKDWKSKYTVEDCVPENLQNLVPEHPPSHLDAPLSSTMKVQQRQLFVSLGRCETQVHRDCFDNIYICAYGERQWAITSPDDSLERERGSVSASISPPPESQDMSASFSCDEPTFMTASLCAGDAIFVPKNFWHSVQSKSKASVAVNWYYGCAETEAGCESIVRDKNKRQKTTY